MRDWRSDLLNAFVMALAGIVLIVGAIVLAFTSILRIRGE